MLHCSWIGTSPKDCIEMPSVARWLANFFLRSKTMTPLKPPEVWVVDLSRARHFRAGGDAWGCRQ